VRWPVVGATNYRRDLMSGRWFEVLRWVLQPLPSDDAPLPVAAPLANSDWSGLLAVVSHERIAGLLVAAVGGGLPVTVAQGIEANRTHRAAVMADLRIENAVLELAELLDSAGVRWRLIKGLAAARLLYPDPAMRSTGDVDVLIHPDDFDRAVALIRAVGGAAWEYISHGPAAERTSAARTFMHVTQVELDVHREVRGHAGRYRVPSDVLFASTQSVELQGRSVLVPSLPVVILHAMLHLSKGGPTGFARLSTLADLVWARARHRDAYRAALKLASALDCATPAAWADQTVQSWTEPVLEPPELAAGGVLSQFRVRAFDRAVGSRFVAGHLHRVVGPHRLRRAWEAAFPAAEFRARHSRTAPAQVKHIAKRLVKGTGASSD
jgi:hypothetical protein